MIKLAACVVLYNPDDTIFENILTYGNYVDKLIVIDNSLKKNNFLIDKNTSMMLVSDYSGKNIDGVKIINFQKDISSQIRHCRRVCLAIAVRYKRRRNR